MTISSEVRKAGPYDGNDVTTSFPFSFKVFSADDVVVVLTDPAGIETTLTGSGTDYSVTLNADQDTAPGGTVEKVSALATGYLLTITSSVPNLQPLDLTNQGGFYPKVINAALDRVTILVQQVSEQVGRAVKTPISSGMSPDELLASIADSDANAKQAANAAAISADAAALSAADAAQLFASSGASLVGYSPAGVGATPTSVQAKLREVVSVKDFGAVGDGVTDDTVAIQAALSSTASEIIFPPGTYRVVDTALDGSPVLTSAVAGRNIRGPGVITATSQVKKLLLVTGDSTTVSLNIDGNSFIGYAVVVQANNPVITGCNIYNLDGLTNYGAVAVALDLDGFDTGAVVSNNVIRNLQGVGDGTGGNGIGTQRAITINSDQNCKKRILVTGNHISQVEGEEGDAIAVISSNGAGTYYDLPVVIENNVIDLWTRRAVKVQANGVSILNNAFSNDRAVNPGSLQRVIDIVQGGGHVIAGNTFKACKYQNQIGAYFSGGEAKNNIAIVDNTVVGLGAETSSSVIQANTYGAGVVVAGNKITCPNFTGIAVAVTNVTEAIVAGNTIQIGTTDWYSFTSSTNVRLSGNTIGNGNVSNYHEYYDPSADEFVLDVSTGRSVTLYQRDTALSDGEIVAKIKCRQNDVSAPNAVHASIGFVAEGSSGSLGVGIFTGGVGTADTEKVRVTAAGVLRPTGDNTQTLGAAANRWSVVYAGTGTINTSDEREKQQVNPIDEAVLRAWARVEYTQFRFNDAVALKGDGARWHFGVIAQRVKEAFEAEGLDPFAYGVLCYDQWDEQPEVWEITRNADGEEQSRRLIQEARPAGNRYGIRYEEALALECAYLRKRLQP